MFVDTSLNVLDSADHKCAKEMTRYSLINTTSQLSKVLDELAALPSERPYIYIDLEGDNLGRNGTTCLMQLHNDLRKHTYLIDLFVLGVTAYTTLAKDGTTSLKTIMESPDIPKAIFAITNDSDALFHDSGIMLDGFIDIQQMEIGCRSPSGRSYLNGLKKLVPKDSGLSKEDNVEWTFVKSGGNDMFAAGYQVFKDRPLSRGLRRYSVNDVVHLPALYRCYDAKLTPQLKEVVLRKTREMIAKTRQTDFDPNGPDKTLSGWTLADDV